MLFWDFFWFLVFFPPSFSCCLHISCSMLLLLQVLNQVAPSDGPRLPPVGMASVWPRQLSVPFAPFLCECSFCSCSALSLYRSLTQFWSSFCEPVQLPFLCIAPFLCECSFLLLSLCVFLLLLSFCSFFVLLLFSVSVPFASVFLLLLFSAPSYSLQESPSFLL